MDAAYTASSDLERALPVQRKSPIFAPRDVRLAAVFASSGGKIKINTAEKMVQKNHGLIYMVTLVSFRVGSIQHSMLDDFEFAFCSLEYIKYITLLLFCEPFLNLYKFLFSNYSQPYFISPDSGLYLYKWLPLHTRRNLTCAS